MAQTGARHVGASITTLKGNTLKPFRLGPVTITEACCNGDDKPRAAAWFVVGAYTTIESVIIE